MDRLQQTICALATPAGEGGIAVVRVSGPDAYPLVEKVFVPLRENRRLADARGYTAMLGHYFLRGEEMDETISLCFRAPHPYTGEYVIELSVHGGAAMADGLLEALLLAGAAPPPGEFTRRVLEHGRLSLTAWVDYPEEDVPELSDAALTAQKAELDDLIAGYGAGAVLRHGVDCVLLGRPNVGKSTLLNLLARFDRAIVTPVAGTTRDVVEQAVQLGEIRLNLFDTAGVRSEDEADAIEAEGIRRSWKKLDEAGVVLAVFDAAQPLTEANLDIARRCQGRPALAILNKQDLTDTTAAAQAALQPYFKQVLPLCARDDALQALCDLTGEDATEATIDEVFATFCVGK